jgi:hypothetical protein
VRDPVAAEVWFGDVNPSGHLSVSVPRHARPFCDSAARLKVAEGLLTSRTVRARQILEYRLKQHELRHVQLVSVELLAEPIDPGLRPELLEVSACRHDQLYAIKAQRTDDIQGRLGVGGGTQIVKAPTQAAHPGLPGEGDGDSAATADSDNPLAAIAAVWRN